MTYPSGRFVSHKVERQLASAEAGTVYRYNVHGVTRFRDERGAFVAADIAKATRGGAKRVLRSKGEVRKVKAPPKAEVARAPRGSDKVLALDVRGQSLSKLVEGNAVDDLSTYIRWKGEVYRVGPDKAATLSDTMRVMVSDYMQDLGDYVDYPELTIEVFETDSGDLIDMDAVTLFHEGLEEELSDDEDAERAADRFGRHVAELMDQMIPSKRRCQYRYKSGRRCPKKAIREHRRKWYCKTHLPKHGTKVTENKVRSKRRRQARRTTGKKPRKR